MIKGNEIRLKGRKNWTSHTVRDVLRRLVGLLSVTWTEPHAQEQGYQFQLEEGNNWWATFNAETNELVIAYRYGNSPKGEELLRAFEVVLKHMYNLRDAVQEDVALPSV